MMNPSQELKYISIGEKIAYYRKQMDMSAPELARKCDLSPGYINNLERGTGVVPTIDSLYKIAFALKTDMDNLIQDNLNIYKSIEIQDTNDKDMLKAFYSLSSAKKECILEILRAYISFRGLLDKPVENDNTYLDELKKQISSSTYIQEMIVDMAPLTETEQSCALDILRNTLSSIDRIVGGKQDV